MNLCQTGGPQRLQRLSRRIGLFLLLLSMSGTIARAEKVENLSPQGYVNDFAGVIDAATKQSISALCQELDTKADAQIAVVTIHSLEGGTPEDFANRLFQKWGVGPKGKDRGVLVLLAVDDHKYYTEVGYGLEPILPDGKVGGFGRQMVPLLRANNYSGALSQMASQIAQVIARDRNITLSQPGAAVPQPLPDRSPDDGTFHGIPPQFILPLIFFLFFGGWRFIAFLLAMMGLRSYRRGRGNGGWWMGPMGGMGGGSSGGSWGGGGFGGFGGGSSGGGGAGGGW